MKKQYVLLLLNTVFALCAAADYQSDYSIPKTEELRALASKIHDHNHKERASKVISLVQANADPNLSTTISPIPLLSLYVKKDNKEVVDCLLRGKADINIVDRYSNTPLFHVSSATMIQLLLSKGANLHYRSSHGRSPLHGVALDVDTSAHAVAALCHADLDPNLVNKNGDSALTELIKRMDLSVYRQKDDANIQKACVLRWYGTEINHINNAGVKAIDTLKRQNAPLAIRLEKTIAKVSSKKEKAKKSLAALLASHLAEIYTDYSGAPGLSVRHVDLLGEMVQEMQDDGQ